MLTAAAVLALAISIAHSYLGEKYIISRLLRRDNLPLLFGDQTFTRQTIRFAWHLTSIAWVGLGVVLMVLARHAVPPIASLTTGTPTLELVQRVVAVTFGLSAAVTAVATRFRHLAWIVFLAIGVLAYFA